MTNDNIYITVSSSIKSVVYTVSQKKLCQLTFCYMSVEHELISVKI